MKPFFLLVTLTLVASPAAFANDQELCENQLQELQNTNMDDLREPTRSQVEDHVKLAQQAQESGDASNCIIHSAKALQELKAPGRPHSREGADSNG